MNNKADTTINMKQKTESGLKPKLRFPEHQDTEEWNIKQLGKYIEEFSKTSTVQDEFEVLTSARDGLVRQKDYYDNNRITERDNIGFNIIPPNYLTYRSRSDDRRFFFNENKLGITGIVSIYYPVFRITSGSNKFFVELLSHYSEVVGKFSIGTSQTVLSLNELKKIKLPLPIPEEQQKIADCLSSIDELIAAQSKKLDTLKAYKKGLMEQLFPAEGETIPKLRFPQFQDASEWEVHELGTKTTKVGSGITPAGGDINYTDKGRPFIRSQNIGWGELLLDDVVCIDDAIHKTFIATEISTNDVLLNITGASIGRSAVATSIIHGGNVNQHVCIIRPKAAELNPVFLNLYLLSQYGQRNINSFQAGGNRQGLNFFQIRSFPIPIPPKKEEQIEIADCLSSVDELIAAQTQKLATLKDYKKGLIQQLFPSLEEMKG